MVKDTINKLAMTNLAGRTVLFNVVSTRGCARWRIGNPCPPLTIYRIKGEYMKIDPKLSDMTKEEIEYFEQHTLDPFECSACRSRSCTVIPLMPQLSEDDTPGLLCNCRDCGEQIACVPITAIGYEMLLRGELESQEEHV